MTEIEAVGGGEVLHIDGDAALNPLGDDQPDYFTFSLVPTDGAALAFGWVQNGDGGGYIDQNTGYFIDADGGVWADFDSCVDAGTEDIQDTRASEGNNYLGPLGQLIDNLGEALGYEYPAQTENMDRTQAADHCANG
ncbi:hypothetical protein [uncultured Erythrobacter sp.]|uniref:hypothetical protein n=1 Tax=uncultured Erythrobacter sp. TaxID=263913 RepID=UPI00260D1316|nr:hypothetical protein [uncultured Erythrobacter sp.]